MFLILRIYHENVYDEGYTLNVGSFIEQGRITGPNDWDVENMKK